MQVSFSLLMRHLLLLSLLFVEILVAQRYVLRVLDQVRYTAGKRHPRENKHDRFALLSS